MATKNAKIYMSIIERNLSTARSGNPWTNAGRGAVRWGENDYVLWNHGKVVDMPGKLVPGGVSEKDARIFVATGRVPKGK